MSVTQENMAAVNEIVLNDGRVTIRELSSMTGIAVSK
jgi:hypothetical protein